MSQMDCTVPLASTLEKDPTDEGAWVLNWARMVDLVVAAMLLSSALLKAISPSQALAATAAWGIGYLAIALIVQLEILLAIWLYSGMANRPARFSAAGMFSIFSVISLAFVLQGHASCGCFGSLKTDPRLVLLVDISVLVALVWTTIVASPCASRSRGRCILAATAYLAVAPSLLILMLAQQPPRLASDTTMDSMSGIVILEPETWVGKASPLKQYITPQVELEGKTTTALIYHHDCPACQKVLPEYVRLAAEATQSHQQVVLIEVPPLGEQREYNSAIHTTLSPDHEWFVQAPVELVIDDGIVTSVRQFH